MMNYYDFRRMALNTSDTAGFIKPCNEKSSSRERLFLHVSSSIPARFHTTSSMAMHVKGTDLDESLLNRTARDWPLAAATSEERHSAVHELARFVQLWRHIARISYAVAPYTHLGVAQTVKVLEALTPSDSKDLASCIALALQWGFTQDQMLSTWTSSQNKVTSLKAADIFTKPDRDPRVTRAVRLNTLHDLCKQTAVCNAALLRLNPDMLLVPVRERDITDQDERSEAVEIYFSVVERLATMLSRPDAALLSHQIKMLTQRPIFRFLPFLKGKTAGYKQLVQTSRNIILRRKSALKQLKRRMRTAP